MQKLLTPINMGALALSHRVAVMSDMPVIPRNAASAAREAASGGLLIQPCTIGGESVIGPKAWRRLNDRAHARGVVSVAYTGWLTASRDLGRAALAVGFDGVEIDATGTTAPEDELQAAVQAVADAVGAERVGVRLAPFAWMSGRDDTSASGSIDRLLCMLAAMEIAYIHVAGTFSEDRGDLASSPLGRHLRAVYRGLLVTSGTYTARAAVDVVESRWADVVALGVRTRRADGLIRWIAEAAASTISRHV